MVSRGLGLFNFTIFRLIELLFLKIYLLLTIVYIMVILGIKILIRGGALCIEFYLSSMLKP